MHATDENQPLRGTARGLTILLVDDDAFGLAWLRHVLGPCAREIVVAHDGRQAWSLLHEGLRPDVCVCDVHLPGMGGLQFLEQVRADPALEDLPFLLVSGAADGNLVREAAASHACAYTQRPYLALQARSVLAAAVLESRRMRSEIACA